MLYNKNCLFQIDAEKEKFHKGKPYTKILMPFQSSPFGLTERRK